MQLEIILSRIGRKIQEVRKIRGVAQQDLAARCNFEKSNMSRIEAGRSNITIETLYNISRSLGVKMSELVDVEEM